MIGIHIDAFIVIEPLKLLDTVVYVLKTLTAQWKCGNFEVIVERIKFSGDHRFAVFIFKAIE